MIIPNLAVQNVQRSIAFYTDIIGMSLNMTVAADRQFAMAPDTVHDPAFAILEWEGSKLMLQNRESLGADMPEVEIGSPNGSYTVYLRGLAPATVIDKLPKGSIVTGPTLSWYGMMELYITDPDGHILCLAAPEGDGPTA